MAVAVAVLGCSEKASDVAEAAKKVCPAAETGKGLVWLEGDLDDIQLEERALPCLSGTGELGGPIVASVSGDSWEAAVEPTLAFRYEMDDPRFHEVQAYFAITQTALHFGEIARVETRSPVTVRFFADRYFGGSFYRGGAIELGLTGTAPRAMPLAIISHEYGHHLLRSFAPEANAIISEAVADFLAAESRDNPSVLAIERLDIPEFILANPKYRSGIERLFERRVDNAYIYPDDVVTHGELCAAVAQAAQFGLSIGSIEERCEAMSEAELAGPEPHLTGRIVAGALWDLRAALGSEVTNALLFDMLPNLGSRGVTELTALLQEADDRLHGGLHRVTIESVFQARGLSQAAQ